MTNEHQSPEHLCAAAAALPREERDAFLDRACSGDPALRLLVAQLLEAEELPDSFLRTPLVAGATSQSGTFEPAAARPEESPPRFADDEVIAGRFQVVRFISRGGMGEVYEVQDRLLHGTRLALKIIRPDIAADPYASRRFEQEVMLARRVSHRNLCPIYDISRCEQPAPPFLFFTMKLLAGESLHARLKRSEQIALEEALLICTQLLEGIAVIHSAGIVHRDIKPNNVMLEPSDRGLCVTIMDFGLARLSESGQTVSRIGMVAGTPGYLAPELLRGATPSAASDLYALGVVLHQVLTGSVPSLSKSGGAAVASPELYRSKAPAGLVAAITDFLSEDPERRCLAFEKAVHKNSLADRNRRRLPTRRSFAVGSVAALGCLGAGTLWKWPELYDLMHPLPAKRFVALLNWPPPSDAKVTPILLGLIDSMVNALSRAEAFDHNFYVACQNFVTEMKTPAQVNDVCESLGANLILATSGSIVSDGIAITLRVLSADSAKELRSRSLHVPAGQQLKLSEQVTRAAAELLNVASLPVSHGTNQVGTEDPEALAAFQAAEALMKEPNNSGLDAAIEKYKLAVEADPHFANAHARLAFAYHRLFWQKGDAASLSIARANAETALALDTDLVEGHAALASIYEDTGDLSAAFREITKALSPDPSNSPIIIRQAHIYFSLNQWQGAEEACKRILKARPNFWEAYNGLGAIYSFQGKYQLALEAFKAASVTAPRNAMPVANAAQMLFFLGHLEQAEAVVLKSIALAPLCWSFGVLADIRLVQGKLAESLKCAIEATKLDATEDTAWLKTGDAYARMKHHDKEAAISYRRALALKIEELASKNGQGSDWIRLALYQAKSGDQATALASMRKADKLNSADIYSLMTKARTLVVLGLHAEASEVLTKCIQMGATSTQINCTNDLEALTSTAATNPTGDFACVNQVLKGLLT